MQLKIREATPADRDAVVRLFHELSPKYEDNPDAYDKAMDAEDTIVFVGELDGVMVGTITLSTMAVASKGLVGYINDLVVTGSQRGKGFGDYLNDWAERYALSLGCGWVELTSHPSRIAANKLYDKRGYKLVDTNKYQLKLPTPEKLLGEAEPAK